MSETTEAPLTLSLEDLEKQAEEIRKKNRDEALVEINAILEKRKLSFEVLVDTKGIVEAVAKSNKQIVLK